MISVYLYGLNGLQAKKIYVNLIEKIFLKEQQRKKLKLGYLIEYFFFNNYGLFLKIIEAYFIEKNRFNKIRSKKS